MPTVLGLGALAVYCCLLIYLSIRDSRRGASDFMIATRRVGWFATMASITGNLRDGAGLAAWVVLGSIYGFGSLWLTVGLSFGLIVFVLIAPEARKQAEAHNYVSVPDMIRERIGPSTARLSVYVVACTALLYSAAQVYVSGRVLETSIGMREGFGIWATAVVVGSYLALGGYRTTIRTGIVQWSLLLIVLVLPWLLSASEPVSLGAQTASSPGARTIVSFVVLSFLVVVSSGDLWQLVFSARDGLTAKLGFSSAIPVYFLISSGMVVFAGVLMHTPGITDPENAIFDLFSNNLIPGFARLAAGLFVVAAIMSTLDSQVFLFASTIAKSIVQGRDKANGEGVTLERFTRICIVVAMIFLALIASTIGSIVQFLFTAVTLGTVLVPILLLSVLGPVELRSIDTRVSLATWAGIFAYVVMFIRGSFDDLLLTAVPATVVAVFLGFSLLVRPRKNAFTPR